MKDIDELKEELEILQEVSKNQLAKIAKLEKENALAIKNITIIRKTFTDQVLELQHELETIKIKYDRLKNANARNPLGAGRKSMDNLWRKKIEECWKAGLKDKEIFGWLTCMDKKGNFHVLSESTYYRFKRRYYKNFQNNFDSN